ncbi:hypothetical protein P4O66_006191, partial [Electrophorus voltai]
AELRQPLALSLWDSPAMEDTLTCSPATFSQVFGRQGQLMQATQSESVAQNCVLARGMLMSLRSSVNADLNAAWQNRRSSHAQAG